MQAFVGAVLVALAFLAAPFGRTLERMERSQLPAPTEAFLALSGFLRDPTGPAGFGLLELGLIAPILRGSLDRVLRTWIVAHAAELTLPDPVRRPARLPAPDPDSTGAREGQGARSVSSVTSGGGAG